MKKKRKKNNIYYFAKLYTNNIYPHLVLAVIVDKHANIACFHSGKKSSNTFEITESNTCDFS